MKLLQKILVIVLALLVLGGTILPVIVSAETDSNNPEIIEEEVLEVDVKVTLKDMDTKEETDHIIVYFTNEKTKEITKVQFLKETGYVSHVFMQAGTYKVKFSSADNKREIVFKGNKMTVPQAKEVAVDLQVKKVLNNNFVPKFFRNNSFLLILLVVVFVIYRVLKKRREMGLMPQRGNQV